MPFRQSTGIGQIVIRATRPSSLGAWKHMGCLSADLFGPCCSVDSAGWRQRRSPRRNARRKVIHDYQAIHDVRQTIWRRTCFSSGIADSSCWGGRELRLQEGFTLAPDRCIARAGIMAVSWVLHSGPRLLLGRQIAAPHRFETTEEEFAVCGCRALTLEDQRIVSGQRIIDGKLSVQALKMIANCK